MQEVLKDNHILTINDVAAILRCSKTGSVANSGGIMRGDDVRSRL